MPICKGDFPGDFTGGVDTLGEVTGRARRGGRDRSSLVNRVNQIGGVSQRLTGCRKGHLCQPARVTDRHCLQDYTTVQATSMRLWYVTYRAWLCARASVSSLHGQDGWGRGREGQERGETAMRERGRSHATRRHACQLAT